MNENIFKARLCVKTVSLILPLKSEVSASSYIGNSFCH